MTLTTDIILVTIAAVSILLNIVQFIVGRRRQDTFIAKLSSAVLKACKNDDFEALERLIDSHRKQRPGKPEQDSCLVERSSERRALILTGSFNGAKVSIDFTGCSPSVIRRVAKKEGKLLAKKAAQCYVMVFCAEAFLAKIAELRTLQHKQNELQEGVDVLEEGIKKFPFGRDLEQTAAEYGALLRQKAETVQAIASAKSALFQASAECSLFLTKYDAAKKCIPSSSSNTDLKYSADLLFAINELEVFRSSRNANRSCS